jgi:hypothetical protein
MLYDELMRLAGGVLRNVASRRNEWSERAFGDPMVSKCPSCGNTEVGTPVFKCGKCGAAFCARCGSNKYAGRDAWCAIMTPDIRCPKCTPSHYDISTASHWNPPRHTPCGVITRADGAKRDEEKI